MGWIVGRIVGRIVGWVVGRIVGRIVEPDKADCLLALPQKAQIGRGLQRGFQFGLAVGLVPGMGGKAGLIQPVEQGDGFRPLRQRRDPTGGRWRRGPGQIVPRRQQQRVFLVAELKAVVAQKMGCGAVQIGQAVAQLADGAAGQLAANMAQQLAAQPAPLPVGINQPVQVGQAGQARDRLNGGVTNRLPLWAEDGPDTAVCPQQRPHFLTKGDNGKGRLMQHIVAMDQV